MVLAQNLFKKWVSVYLEILLERREVEKAREKTRLLIKFKLEHILYTNILKSVFSSLEENRVDSLKNQMNNFKAFRFWSK